MGLKQAWRVACSTKERALAEYIFERLEPYLSDDEVQACVEQLQVLAMERLEGIGLSGDDLMEMTEALSGDFMEMVGPMMAAAVHGEDAAMAQARLLAAPSGRPAGRRPPSRRYLLLRQHLRLRRRRGAHALFGRGPGRHSRVRRFRRHAELPPRAGRHASRRQPSVLLAGPGGCEPLHAGHGGRAGTTGHPHAHGGDLPRRAHALRQRPGHRCREARQPAPRLCGPGHPGAGGSRSVGSAGHRCRRRHGGLLHGRHVPGAHGRR